MKNKKGITLIALVITIIVLLILAGVSIATITGENGILKRASNAAQKSDEVAEDENQKISSYENEIDNYNVSNGARDSLTETQIRAIIKDELAKGSYQKLRSDVSIDVTLKNGGTFTAPTDGYYILGASVTNSTNTYQMGVKHYTVAGTLIGTYNPSGYCYNTTDGVNIYMKKDEYLTFWKENNVTVNFSKFWYAEGQQPSE